MIKNKSYHIYQPTLKYTDIKTNKVTLAFKESGKGDECFVIFEKHSENVSPEQREKFEEVWIAFRNAAYQDCVLLFNIDDVMEEVNKQVNEDTIFPIDVKMNLMDYSRGMRVDLASLITEMPKGSFVSPFHYKDPDNEFWGCEEEGCDFSAELPEDGILPKECPKCGSKFVSTITFSASEGG